MIIMTATSIISARKPQNNWLFIVSNTCPVFLICKQKIPFRDTDIHISRMMPRGHLIVHYDAENLKNK